MRVKNYRYGFWIINLILIIGLVGSIYIYASHKNSKVNLETNSNINDTIALHQGTTAFMKTG